MRIGKGADGDAVVSRTKFGFPIDRGAAVGTEMDAELVAAVPIADVKIAGALDRDLRLGIIGADAEHRTGATLALDAMAGHDKAGLAAGFHPKAAAAAMRGADHGASPKV